MRFDQPSEITARALAAKWAHNNRTVSIVYRLGETCHVRSSWMTPVDGAAVAWRYGPDGRAIARPMPGDLARLAAPWAWGDVPRGSLPVGSVDVIETCLASDGSNITFNARAFFDGRRCSCGGGPGTVVTPLCELRPTDSIREQKFWRWRDFPRAGGGVDFRLSVPVWDWFPPTR
ncbi:MAG: hypothetical protein GKS00_01995 [Alphaproteobacteria bacterium]|nr:hypothetical protein [Alphaproteobacteria bacterium]